MNLDYRDWEELEDEALEESQQTKKKPKKKVHLQTQIH